MTALASPVKVWVELRDKGSVRGDGLAWENAPVYAPYLQQLRKAGFTPDVALKWQNRVSGWIESSNLAALQRLPMVQSVEGMPRKAAYLRLPHFGFEKTLSKTSAALTFGVFQQSFDTTQATTVRAALPSGQGAGQNLRIAIIDADFYLKHDAFAYVKLGRIADQWDFVLNQRATVRDTFGESHGAAVFSLLAAKTSTLEGLVPEAKYLLYRAENEASETYVEEDYVAAAIERAVDSGAQVINISLGYRYDYTNGSANLPYSSMNGRTRPSSKAAVAAARRGVLLSIAMGNEGVAHPGPNITAPADADSVISVGIMDLNQRPCNYSSTGPTYDGRIKPEVTAIGTNSCTAPTVDPKTASGVEYQGGTSFAAPVIAGIAALLRQLHPAVSSQTIRLALIATARNAQRPDSAGGYGLVRANEAHKALSSSAIIHALEEERDSKKGLLGWEQSARRVFIPWRLGVDPAGIRLWDMRGRTIQAHGGGALPVFWIDPAHDQAAGVYVWRMSQ